MGLPRQVREAQEKTDAMVEAIKSEKDTQPVIANAENQNAPQPQPASHEPMGVVVHANEPIPSIVDEPPIAPVDVPMVQVQEQNQILPETAMSDEFSKLRKSYDSLQGRFNKIKAEKEVYEERFTVMQNQLMELTMQIKNLQSSPLPNQTLISDDLSFASEDDRLKYDEDTLRLISRGAKTTAESMVNPLREELQRQSHELFMDRLRTRVSGFDEINTDAEFIDWLEATNDGTSGFNKMQTLQMAFDVKNVDRITKFFDEWKGKQSGNPKPPTPINLSSRVSPTKANLSPAPQIQKRIYSAREYSQMGKDITSGKYLPSDVEKIKLEMAMAVSESRVQG